MKEEHLNHRTKYKKMTINDFCMEITYLQTI
jgi:hypothetical protein